MTREEVSNLLREKIGKERGGASQWSKRHGVNRGIISNVLSGQKAPTPQILAALGLKKVVRYEAKK